MALMSSLLFVYSLVVIAPQVLGAWPEAETLKPIHIKILHKYRRFSVNNKQTEVQRLFNEYACKRCNLCMARAIKAYKKEKVRYNDSRSSADDVQNDKLAYIMRFKREEEHNVTSTRVLRNIRRRKHITITKLKAKDKIIALKVKETSVIGLEHVDICKVFSINKSFQCGSPEAKKILQEAKIKIHRYNEGTDIGGDAKADEGDYARAEVGADPRIDKRAESTQQTSTMLTTTKMDNLFKKKVLEYPSDYMLSFEDLS